jgi:hypothetical protein
MSSLFDNIANAVMQEVSPVVSSAAKSLLSGNGGGSSSAQAIKASLAGLSNEKLALMGGISLARAKEIMLQSAGTSYAKKNLFYVSVANVSPLSLPFETVSALTSGDFFSVDTLANMASMAVSYLNWGSFDFNLFATEVSYSPVTLNGSTMHAGGAAFNILESREPVEMRITTLDDSVGSLKNWFRKKSNVMVLPGGALGLPISYLLKIRVTHSFIEDDADGAGDAYYDEFIMRPVSLDTDLSRREDGLQELHMTFTQFDNFTTMI